jgi:addiction module HigA family antidote
MATYKKKRPVRKPTHPGAILKRMWLDELGLTQSEFAKMLVDSSPKKIKVSTMQTKLNELINSKRAMTAEFAVLISKVLGTSPKMWMNLQTNLDIWEAENEVEVA